MTTKEEVEVFLKDLNLKVKIFDILFLDDRGKNAQSLYDLDIPPNRRKEIIKELEIEDYSEGPITEQMRNLLPMWVFGKTVKHKEVYIKISLGQENSNVICISFHLAEHSMNYPFKK
jgi:hypothetical protein